MENLNNSSLVRRSLSPLSLEYPMALRDLADAPPVLSVEGRVDFDSCAVLGVVGARDSSVMAESWMRRNLPELTKLALIVSGGARGIDELAHQIAIHERRPTAVVLPSSLDCPYPADWSHRRSQVIASGGCLISEYQSGTQIRRSHFEKRNRIIAALSDVVLVVEARRRSGTAITARHAGKIGRTVAALPWFPSDPRGELCNDLIFGKDALLVRNAEDVAELLKSAAGTRVMRMQRAMLFK
jgi:DNA processing protein